MISLLETRSSRLKRLQRVACVACDLDGTLLRSDNRIGDEVLLAARDLMSAGIQLVLASGRTDGFTREYAAILGTDAPIISLNGALVRDTSHGTLHVSVLPTALREEIDTLQQRGTVPVSVSLFTESGIYVEEENPSIPRYLRSHPQDVHRLSSISAMYDQTALLILSGSYTAVQQYSVAISRRFRRKLQRILYQSGSGKDRFYLEVRNASASKATGLNAVLKHFGIPRKASASIGDYTNDIEMCKFTGVSAAMRNGCNELKAVTDVVTLRSNEEDGVAEFFRLILSHRTG